MFPLIANILGEIWGFVANLFNTDGFPARWYCGPAWQEQPGVGWLHIGSDIAIFGAYLAIPVMLAWFVTRRRDFPFPSLIILFALFIVSCGIVHLVEAVIFWEPVYRLSGAAEVGNCSRFLGNGHRPSAGHSADSGPDEFREDEFATRSRSE